LPLNPSGYIPKTPNIFCFAASLSSWSRRPSITVNRPFDFEKYLDDPAAKKMTLTRTFLLFREQQVPEYFERLGRFLRKASEKGVVARLRAQDRTGNERLRQYLLRNRQ
jgi:hypothetical protein